MLTGREVTKRFGDKRVLDSLSFSVLPGRPLCLLGGNGSGKTTLLRILAGLIKCDGGRILLSDSPPRSEEVGYMPEERGLYAKSKVNEQLVYFGRLRGMSRVEAEKRADMLLDRLMLSEYKNDPAGLLSKGCARRLSLAVALINDPKLIILDEPFDGADIKSREVISNIIEHEAGRQKIIVFSSHRTDVLKGVPMDIMMLDGGKAAFFSSAEDIGNSSVEEIFKRLTGGGEGA